jgi:hypothetical protein
VWFAYNLAIARYGITDSSRVSNLVNPSMKDNVADIYLCLNGCGKCVLHDAIDQIAKLSLRFNLGYENFQSEVVDRNIQSVLEAKNIQSVLEAKNIKSVLEAKNIQSVLEAKNVQSVLEAKNIQSVLEAKNIQSVLDIGSQSQKY